jgi:hypothetical protein
LNIGFIVINQLLLTIALIMVVMGLAATWVFWVVYEFWWTPLVSRRFRWLKRHKRSIVWLADDAGWMGYDFPEEILPEGVYHMKDDSWHFLPRPRFTNPDGARISVNEEVAFNIIQRRFIFKELGVPMWIGYAGRLPLVNPLALAVTAERSLNSVKTELGVVCDVHIQELIKTVTMITPETNYQNVQAELTATLASLKVELDTAIAKAPGPTVVERIPEKLGVAEIRNYVKTLPPDFQPRLEEFLDKFHDNPGASTPVTYIDNSDVKRLLPRAYTPTQVRAIAKNRELYGMERVNRGLFDKLWPLALILGLGIILIIVFAVAYQWMHPTPQATKDLILNNKPVWEAYIKFQRFLFNKFVNSFSD